MTGPTSELLQPGRGDIWLAALSKGRSGELGKTRPVVVVSPDDYGPYSSIDSVVVVPLSASARPGADRVALSARQGLDRDSVALTRAVRGLARS
ncbi:MAG: type II toxin-antitoxin system PemK/MazF family toxin, partial [Bifidobacteriaceae bacterium]|nr:type II toxin-antitoxin system PemK/MazF family toxin [Bifidobacteriaceae bacterium]